MNSAPMTRSMAALSESVVEAAKMVIALTSAKPIISADAVAADRRGCRAALSTASRPTVPKVRGRGQPMPRDTGVVSTGAEDDDADQGQEDPEAHQRGTVRTGRGGAGDEHADAEDEHDAADDGTHPQRPRGGASRRRAAQPPGGCVRRGTGGEQRSDDREGDTGQHPDEERSSPRWRGAWCPGRARRRRTAP